MNISLDNTEYYSYTERVRALVGGNLKKAYVTTFGCQQNEADGEQIKGILCNMGYSLTNSHDDADVIIVNTCAIREHAEAKVFSMLGNFKARKKQNSELIIGVCGCMSAEEHVVKALKNDFHYISFTLEPNRLFDIPEIIYGILTNGKRVFPIGKDDGNLVEGLPTVRTQKHKAWVSIMYGCNNFCSYCIVPYTRGRERSRKSEVIISECEKLISSGCREITLLGQNVNSYNSDMDFAELIGRIADIEGDFIIRFMTSHPKDVSDKLISVIKSKSNKIAPFFHLPLQSGSSNILKKMNRAYTKERYIEVVRKLRDAVPNIALSTDIIVGFPGESEDDFKETLDVLKSVEYDLVYAFIYSPRKGTPAAELDEQVPLDIKTERLTRLLKIQDNISLKKNLGYVGTVHKVLADKRMLNDGNFIYEGKTLTNKSIHFTSERDVVGEFTKVKITKAAPFDLYGEAITK